MTQTGSVSTKLVCVGIDQPQVDSRCSLLREAGFTVTGCRPSELNLCISVRVDLVIISMSLPEEDLAQISALAKSHGCKVLTSQAFTPPLELLKAVNEALNESV